MSPTVGSNVYLYQTNLPCKPGEPILGVIVYVSNDEKYVNVLAIDGLAQCHPMLNIPFFHSHENKWNGPYATSHENKWNGPYATWMPYQVSK